MENQKDLEKHQTLNAHQETMEHYGNITTTKANDGVNMISSDATMKQSQNCQMLLKIITNIRYQARQSLPL